jgi:hypothetical protein
MDNDKRFVFRWWMFIVFLSIATIIISGLLHFTGTYTFTIFERKVFENSYQYSEARKTEQMQYKAALEEINIKLRNPNLTKEDKINLNAQKSAIQIRLRVSNNR